MFGTPAPRPISDTIGWAQSQCDSTPRHCSVATLFSVLFAETHCCVLLLASHFTVRSQFRPLPGAGVSCPATSRHSPFGATTVVWPGLRDQPGPTNAQSENSESARSRDSVYYQKVKLYYYSYCKYKNTSILVTVLRVVLFLSEPRIQTQITGGRCPGSGPEALSESGHEAAHMACM